MSLVVQFFCGTQCIFLRFVAAELIDSCEQTTVKCLKSVVCAHMYVTTKGGAWTTEMNHSLH